MHNMGVVRWGVVWRSVYAVAVEGVMAVLRPECLPTTPAPNASPARRATLALPADQQVVSAVRLRGSRRRA